MSGLVCTREPISWLRLELFRLGELPAGDRETVRAHIEACPACAACLSEIDRPLVLPAISTLGRSSLFLRIRRALLGLTPAGTLLRVALVGLAFVFFVRPTAKPVRVASVKGQTASGIKGSDVTFALVRDRNGIVEHEATTFAPQDRFKVLVTCPTDEVLFWDVAVLDGGQVSFPLAPSAPIACGNHVPLPGAFRLSGATAVEVCLVWANDPIERNRLAVKDSAYNELCTQLQHADPEGPSLP